jgi:hypothetical protein
LPLRFCAEAKTAGARAEVRESPAPSPDRGIPGTTSPKGSVPDNESGHNDAMVTLLLIVIIVILLLGGGGYYYRGRR